MMVQELDIFYVDRSDNVVHSEHIPFAELFLRKLVDATFVRNQIWEHEQHENRERLQAVVRVHPWSADAVDDYGTAIESTLYSRFDVSPYYEIQWLEWHLDQFVSLRCEQTGDALRAAAVMLDHAHDIQGKYYDVQYAVLDLDRRKLLVFLTLM
jgi:hypothetical protein